MNEVFYIFTVSSLVVMVFQSATVFDLNKSFAFRVIFKRWSETLKLLYLNDYAGLNSKILSAAFLHKYIYL